MKKYFWKIRRGSALLVAMLVMGILITITLGLSALIIGEIRQTGDMVAAGKAYYAADAGVENALLDLHEHLPGYQTTNSQNTEGWIKSDENDISLSYRYQIRNQGNSYPYFDKDKPIYLQPGVASTKDFLYNSQSPDMAANTYNVLPLHGTVTIPLFVDCGDGVNFKDVKNFMLQYYVNFNLPSKISGQLQYFDILRWKLFGEPSGLPGKTDAISDFYPAGNQDSAINPVCIGSDFSMLENYHCTPAVAKYVPDLPDSVADWSALNKQVTDDFSQAWGAARECYTTDAGIGIGSIKGDTGIQKDCSMSTFMKTHKKNYLTITNVVNPQIIDISNPDEQAAAANIYYRIVAEKDPAGSCPGETSGGEDVMTREYAEISADGYASGGAVTQSIDVKLKLNSFLPVFNFSLFRTNTDKVDPDVQTKASLPLNL
jgi:type II secretory pathway pseudopilin PulG